MGQKGNKRVDLLTKAGKELISGGPGPVLHMVTGAVSSCASQAQLIIWLTAGKKILLTDKQNCGFQHLSASSFILWLIDDFKKNSAEYRFSGVLNSSRV